MIRVALLLAIFSGFLAVLLGAFGAHALKSIGADNLINTWKTASFYHFLHTVIILILITKQSLKPLSTHSFNLIIFGFFTGIVLFSGSLYVYVVSGIIKVAIITPFGGLCLLLSWAYWLFCEYKTNE